MHILDSRLVSLCGRLLSSFHVLHLVFHLDVVCLRSCMLISCLHAFCPGLCDCIRFRDLLDILVS